MKKINDAIIIAAFVFATSLAGGHAQGTNSLVSWWPGEGNANDIVGTNNGTLFNGVTFTTGEVGQAFDFNGSSYVSIPDSPSLDQFVSRITVAAWIKSGTLNPGFNTIVAKGNSSWRVMCGSAGHVTFSTTGLSTTDFTGNKNVCDGQWHHVACVYDGTNKFIYVDGALDASTPVTGSIAQTGSALGIGYNSDTGYFWNGLIDEVRLYNRALSSNEVALFSEPLQITQDLTNFYAAYGQRVTIGVTATSSSPLSYQWYFQPANNAGQAEANAEIISGFVYGTVVTNGGFGYGSIPGVSFTGGGGAGAAGYATVSNGVVVGITVTNAGSGYTSIPAVVISPPNGELFGQTNQTLTISNAETNSLGNYYVVVSETEGGNGSLSSAVVNLTLEFPPAITNQPQSEVVYAHTPTAFSVGVAGSAPLSYQWTLNGTNLPAANFSTLIVSNVTPNQLGTYAVTVTNSLGSVTSSNAQLSMYPYIVSPFAGLDTYWGQTNTLSVGAWGSGTLTYQWYQNGVALPGATSSTLTISDIQFTNAGSYYVVVSSPLGSATNAPSQVIVNPANVTIMLTPDVVVQGTVGNTYIIESTTNLSNPNSWIVETNLTLTQPIENWNDNSGDVRNSPRKFYQVLPGQ